MDYMFSPGFLGTKAPFFMDFVTLIVAILPLLVYGSVLFVRKGMLRTHILTQVLIYFVSVIVVFYFEYGVRSEGGFDYFMQNSDANYSYALIVLVLHVIIAVVTFVYWSITVFKGGNWYSARELPGKMSAKHKMMGLKSFIGIIFTSFSGIWVYVLLFIA